MQFTGIKSGRGGHRERLPARHLLTCGEVLTVLNRKVRFVTTEVFWAALSYRSIGTACNILNVAYIHHSR